jgi:hypothetical protein
VWIEAMETGRAGRFGLGYNAAVWAESRKFAVEFLEEARQRMDDGLHALFDRAISQYDIVARNLRTVSDTYPFQQCQDAPVATDDRARATAGLLKETRDAEAAGLDILAEVVAALNG